MWSWEPQQTAIYGALGVSTPHFWKLHITTQMLRITFVLERGYIDFARLFVFTICSAFFVVRTKENGEELQSALVLDVQVTDAS